MTRQQFQDMIAIAESGGDEKAIGDNGLAAGRYQMHWVWRLDFWPEWAWELLALVDQWALLHFIVFNRDGTARRPITARALADLYNTGHPAADPAYDARCLRALEAMGIVAEEFDQIVE